MRSVRHVIYSPPNLSDRAYDLFRNRLRPELLCAVPADYPLPDFIEFEGWAYEGSLRQQDVRPSGFNDRAASVGVRFNGFYLFQLTADYGKAMIGQPAPEPEASLTVRKHVRTVLLRLVAKHTNPDQVIEYLCRATADRRSAEAWYAELLAVLPFATYTTDATGFITYFNEAAVTLWGRRPALGWDRWCGSWHIYSLDGAPLPHDRCPMAVAILEDRRIRGVTAIAERPDGSRVRFRPFPTPLHDNDENLVGAINVLLDLGAA